MAARETIAASLAAVAMLAACASFDEASDADAGGPAKVFALECGKGKCSSLNQPLCCDPGNASTCVASSGDCPSSFVYRCDDVRDCAALGRSGEICCGVTRDGRQSSRWPVTKTYCAPSCKDDEIELCELDAPSCSKGSCKPDQRIDIGAYAVCL